MMTLSPTIISRQVSRQLLRVAILFLIAAWWGTPSVLAQSTINTANSVVNSYSALAANAAAGTITISLPASMGSGFTVGSSIFLVQMQGAAINQNEGESYGSVTNANSAGLYEVRTIVGRTGGNASNPYILTLSSALTNSYTVAGKAQAVLMPVYKGLTINAPGSIVAAPWNGTTGGVVALIVTGDLTVSAGAKIDVSGQGFRGGSIIGDNQSAPEPTLVTLYRSPNPANGGEKGEGIAGYQADYTSGRYGRGAPANGGGGGNSHNAGGGGGSNASANPAAYTGLGNPDRGPGNAYDAAWRLESPSFATTSSEGGGRGGYSYSGANQNPLLLGPNNAAWNSPVVGSGQPGGNNRSNVGGRGGRGLNAGSGSTPRAGSQRRLFLGGGGGAGDSNNLNSGDGGSGGGLIYLVATGTVSGGGSLLANGAEGASAGSISAISDAASGGGGGGSIVINSQKALSGLTLAATGGAGGSQGRYAASPNETEGPGGGGGGGYIGYTTGGPGSLNVAPGANGDSRTDPFVSRFPPNGATRGASGSVQQFAYASDYLVPLPVQLLSFWAVAENSAVVKLTWTTSAEINSSYFEVERSTDSNVFDPIGKVAAAGNSSTERSYELRDAALPAGTGPLYYRLRQVALDGTAIYSAVVMVARLAPVVTLMLTPNPTAAVSTLTGAPAGAIVWVFDVLGRPLFSVVADQTGTARLELRRVGMPTGLYVVRTGKQYLRLVLDQQ
ncbi:hypothetical protein [Hymenobacter amundsenii]|uniref:hypothetical protein n=1 Tax=Hymenobacter amundsenii TaxID=2006685 RepID=UPI000F839D7B|nr:hypothetical protein [Hymenobacter amundsenii]